MIDYPIDHHSVRFRLLLRGSPPDRDAQVSYAIQVGPPTGYRAHREANPAPVLDSTDSH